MRTILLALTLAVLAGCTEPTHDPEGTFRLFVERVQQRDVEGAWALLAPESRERLARLAGEDEDPRQAVIGNARVARQVERITVERQSEEEAILLVESGGRSDRIRMVRTEGGWRVAVDPPVR